MDGAAAGFDFPQAMAAMFCRVWCGFYPRRICVLGLFFSFSPALDWRVAQDQWWMSQDDLTGTVDAWWGRTTQQMGCGLRGSRGSAEGRRDWIWAYERHGSASALFARGPCRVRGQDEEIGNAKIDPGKPGGDACRSTRGSQVPVKGQRARRAV